VIAALALLGYAALLLTAGAEALARARWADRAPRLGVTACLALAGSAVVSVVLGGVALVVPTPIGRARTAAGLLTVAALAAFPLVLLGGPAAAVSAMSYCPHTVAAVQAAMCAGHCGSAGC
jgi:hypothetical protein